MSLATITLPVSPELREVEDLISKSCASDIELVDSAAKYVIGGGGKRIRPAMLLLSAKLLGICKEKSVPLAAAVEMVHAASLLHDDVLDNAKVRRGRASTNAKWGNQISILVGDYLWCKASDLAIRFGSQRVLSALIEGVWSTTEGEILEIVTSNNFTISSDEYLKIIKLKTAMLFSCSCKIGAIAAGAPEKFEQALADYGLNVGIAFQLIDDVLDYTATEERFGKKAGTDLCEGKLTLPVIIALKKCSSSEAAIIRESLLSNSLDETVLLRVIDILKKYSTLEETQSLAKSYAERAKNSIAFFKPSLEKDSMTALADFAVSRGL